MTAPANTRTVADDVYEEVRRQILSGGYRPGTRLSIRSLAQSYGVSAMPAREALKRLQVEGLVVFDRRTVTVVALGPAEVRQLFEIRLRLEQLATEWSLAAVGEEDLSELRSILDEMADPAIPAGRWRTLNRSFHQRFYECGQSRHLLDLVRNMWDRVEPYMAIYASTVEDFGEAQRQHERLFELVRARDLPRLLEETAHHLEHTATTIIAALGTETARSQETRMSFDELTIESFHARLKTGEVSSRQLVDWYLTRIQKIDVEGPGLNAVVTLNPDAAAQAAELDDELATTGRPRGPLHGVPVLVKDQAETAGIPTAFGSKLFEHYVPEKDATVITWLKEAGAVILGKTTMCDFAAGWFSFSSRSEHTKNPYDHERETGGSSAGTAASVAANLCLVGIGEDTGGSIRLPASFNNLFGLRVTTGLVPRTGFSPLVHFQDTPGPMARTVPDLAAVLDVITGFDPADPFTALAETTSDVGHYLESVEDVTAATLADFRIGVLADAFGEGVDEEATNGVVRSAISRLGVRGTTVVEDLVLGDLAAWVEGTSLYTTQSRQDITDFLAVRPNAPMHSFDEIAEAGVFHPLTDLMKDIAAGPAVPTDDPEYYPRRMRQDQWRRRLLAIMAEAGVDFLVYPTVQVPAPTRQDLADRRWTALTFPTNTVIASQTSLPAVTVPAGFTTDGLPVGLEVLGKPLSERALLRFARAWELAASPRRPSPLLDSATVS